MQQGGLVIEVGFLLLVLVIVMVILILMWMILGRTLCQLLLPIDRHNQDHELLLGMAMGWPNHRAHNHMPW
jgi:hypothetical protein